MVGKFDEVTQIVSTARQISAALAILVLLVKGQVMQHICPAL